MTLAPDTRLGAYEIQSPLGAGGMGEVYRARDTTLGRDVAIKVLPAFLSHEPDRLRRFEQEARAAAESRNVYVPPTQRGMAHRPYLSPDGRWVLLAEMDGRGRIRTKTPTMCR